MKIQHGTIECSGTFEQIKDDLRDLLEQLGGSNIDIHQAVAIALKSGFVVPFGSGLSLNEKAILIVVESRAWLGNSFKMKAIKQLKERAECSLKESKTAIDDVLLKLSLKY